MKAVRNIVCISVLILLTGSLFAQTNTFPSSGNVGNGTTSPSSKLEVYTSSGNAATGIVLSQGNSSENVHSGRLFFTNTGEVANSFTLMKTGDRFGIRSDATPGSSSGIERVSFLKNGYVGIGTASPETKLHIKSSNEGVKSGYADFIIEEKDAQLDILSGPDATWGSSINLIEGAGVSNNDMWSIVRQTTAGNGDSSLRFNFGTINNHTNENKLILKSDGSVGIGTTNPDEKLTVAGTGKFREVIVEENTGADFVFEKGV